jgi:hypothetical protein
MVAVIQPLHGTETMGLMIRRGIVGDPLFNVVLQESASGSQAHVRPIGAENPQPDVIAQIISGC